MLAFMEAAGTLITFWEQWCLPWEAKRRCSEILTFRLKRKSRNPRIIQLVFHPQDSLRQESKILGVLSSEMGCQQVKMSAIWRGGVTCICALRFSPYCVYNSNYLLPVSCGQQKHLDLLLLLQVCQDWAIFNNASISPSIPTAFACFFINA